MAATYQGKLAGLPRDVAVMPREATPEIRDSRRFFHKGLN